MVKEGRYTIDNQHQWCNSIYIATMSHVKKTIKKIRKKFTRRDVVMIGAGIAITTAGVLAVNSIERHETALTPESSRITSPWIPDTVKYWEKPISEMAKRYDIDPNLIAIIITLESGGYPKATSEVNAKGLMQIMPLTAEDIAKRYVKKPQKKYDLHNPETSIEFGTAYLAMLRNEYGTAKQGPSWNDTVELIAAAYNGGFSAANALEKGEGLRDTQTLSYSRDAFNMWRERHSETSPTFDRWKERGGDELIQKAKEWQQ